MLLDGIVKFAHEFPQFRFRSFREWRCTQNSDASTELVNLRVARTGHTKGIPSQNGLYDTFHPVVDQECYPRLLVE
jgi:hypothetical protein